MIKKVKASLSEKILLIFLISLGIFSFSFFFITKNKCFFVKKINLEKIQTFIEKKTIKSSDTINANLLKKLKIV